MIDGAVASEPEAASPPVGWYPDWTSPGALRWWDGTQWTNHLVYPQSDTPRRPAPRRRAWAISAIVVGVALMVIAVIVVVNSVVAPAVQSSVKRVTANQIGPVGASINYSMGHGDLTYLPMHNDSLAQTAASERSLVYFLNADYAGTATGAATNGRWPHSLTVSADGTVTAAGGRVIGNYVIPGSHFRYAIQPDGSFVLEISSPRSDEVAVYDSATTDYWAWCATSDTSCVTNSPTPPVLAKPAG